ncbi:ImmA/IrrE family metallo-endopeptidase [Actinokineospora sp. PR83]|uniref:ImmA/IrrE family metallo-endopeptidase n=1 Tax=Actinokineospora sp. PR83 TaxID=2884908 RepID=UPI001F17AAE0|nr:ImmA/IrrE family metallo-endopeptidase [Actinokineospora sp. PR83]MCG8914916.1 ImmA/IrrE family metallo-endopeptidase [Actinokineospora sp. PR83]
MTTTQQTSVPPDIVAQLRAMAPLRPLTQGDAYTIAEYQASKALELAGITSPHVALDWILDLPHTEVRLEPRHAMHRLSGSMTYTGGRYLILINKNDAHARRRYSLAHEWKHVIDDTAAKVLYSRFGHGDELARERKVERIADHFAACLLMPRLWVKGAWMNGIQDLPALAGLFMVSEEAMRIRLTYLGLLDDEVSREHRTYFRRVASPDLCCI